MLPNLIVIGAGKSGTSALYHYLLQHPEIKMTQVKELRFFNEKWKLGLDWYEKQWEGSTKPVRGEATPAYTHYPWTKNVPERMHQVIPEAKLVYLVRDPMDRLLSSYMNDYAAGREHREPAQALDPTREEWRTDVSRYAFQLDQYLPYYPMDRILVVAQEDLLADRRGTLREIFRFLEVDESFDSPKFDQLRNVSTQKRRVRWPRSRFLPTSLMPSPEKKFLPWKTRARMKHYAFWPLSEPVTRPTLSDEQKAGYLERFKPDADRLRELTGKPFSGWSV